MVKLVLAFDLNLLQQFTEIVLIEFGYISQQYK